MASSRLERIGTIFSRITGLLRSGAMKEEDTPIWYAVYKAFPPQYEPKYDRPAPNISIQNIFYPEDEIRAKFHKNTKFLGTVTLGDVSSQTNSQKFISAYNQLNEEGNVSGEKLYQAALNRVKFDNVSLRDEQNPIDTDITGRKSKRTESLASSFREAQTDRSEKSTLNIKDIFKD